MIQFREFHRNMGRLFLATACGCGGSADSERAPGNLLVPADAVDPAPSAEAAPPPAASPAAVDPPPAIPEPAPPPPTPAPNAGEAAAPDRASAVPPSSAGPALPMVSRNLQGCSAVGDYARVYFEQRDAASGECVELVLESPADADPAALPDLTLPEGWGVREMWWFRCDAPGKPLDGRWATFGTAEGQITFSNVNLPEFAALDVRLSGVGEAEGVAAPPAARLVSQRLELVPECTNLL